jgi:PKD repeat protein
MRISSIFLRRRAAAAVLALAASGCSVSEQTPPSIAGPSELSLVLNVSATPETISRDGASQSTITVVARTASGEPVVGQRLRLSSNGPANTQFSATDVFTDTSGRATVDVTAPPSTSVGNLIQVGLTPVDASGNPTRVGSIVSIGLTPSNSTAPTAAFTFAPTAPGVNETVTFNASTSTDEGAVCGTGCSYAWSFGDGNTGSGMIVTKSYSSSGNKTVTLTVTDPSGVASAPTTQTVAVAAPAPPAVGTVTVSPTPVRPNASSPTNFDAGGATVGAGATIVEYRWSWGDGTSDTVTTEPRAQHTFDRVGTFTVRTTVVDSLGRTASTTTTVTVANP